MSKLKHGTIVEGRREGEMKRRVQRKMYRSIKSIKNIKKELIPWWNLWKGLFLGIIRLSEQEENIIYTLKDNTWWKTSRLLEWEKKARQLASWTGLGRTGKTCVHTWEFIEIPLLCYGEQHGMSGPQSITHEISLLNCLNRDYVMADNEN